MNSRVVKASPEKVWDVLADGWLYPLFVVGASRMREVDDGWPAVGTRLHHSAGAWPVLVNDETEVLEVDTTRLLRLRAKGWPAGEAEVVITVEPHDDGSEVVISEDVATGPGRIVPKPVRDPMIHWRNSETLRRLAFLAERR